MNFVGPLQRACHRAAPRARRRPRFHHRGLSRGRDAALLHHIRASLAVDVRPGRVDTALAELGPPWSSGRTRRATSTI